MKYYMMIEDLDIFDTSIFKPKIPKPDLKCRALIAYHGIYKQDMPFTTFKKNLEDFRKKTKDNTTLSCLNQLDLKVLRFVSRERLNHIFSIIQDKESEKIMSVLGLGAAAAISGASIAVLSKRLAKTRADKEKIRKDKAQAKKDEAKKAPVKKDKKDKKEKK